MVKSELTGETQRPKFSKPVKVLVVVVIENSRGSVMFHHYLNEGSYIS